MNTVARTSQERHRKKRKMLRGSRRNAGMNRETAGDSLQKLIHKTGNDVRRRKKK
jgi:hypothetical protein